MSVSQIPTAGFRCLAAILLMAVAPLAQAILPIQHWTTSSGARVYFVGNADLTILDVSVEFPAGFAFDTAETSGLASMTNAMLRKGAAGLGEDAIAQQFADIGAQVRDSFDGDKAGISVRTLSDRRRRDAALSLFARVLARPEFPAEILAREKVRAISSIRESDLKPDTVANRNFSRLVYGKHPYALRASGEVDTLNRIRRDDLVRFYERHYAAPYAVVAIMGNVRREEAEAIAEQLTADLPKSSEPEPQIPPVPVLEAGIKRIIAHPATQSHILIGAPGIRRDDPDYFPLFVGNYILGGGGFVSRLIEEVRSKRGLAYSAYSYFSPQARKGPFIIGLQTRRDQATESLSVVRDTLNRFLTGGPTEAELLAAKSNIVGGFPMRIDSNRKMHGYLGMIGFYRLPHTYLEDFVANVEKVTVDDIRSAFARRVDAGRLVTVVVAADGKPAAAPPAH